MLVHALLICLEVISIGVYADLWIVYKYKKHFFEPLLSLISEKQRKVYQGVYRKSLVRSQFCVSDKVDVSGTTFTAVLCVTHTYSLILNLTAHYYLAKHVHHLLWLNGLVWFTYMMYALVAYRDMRELCFYCKYSMSAAGIHFILLCIVNEGELPWYLFSLMTVITGLVIMST